MYNNHEYEYSLGIVPFLVEI